MYKRQQLYFGDWGFDFIKIDYCGGEDVYKRQIPTRTGLYIYETVRGMKIADPALTSGWETQLAEMEQGKLTQEEFLEGALKLAGEVTEEIFRKCQK